jgi:DNA-binding NarL/FixJ family response regulator
MLIGTIGPGDCVGEMSLLDNAPRSATVRSVAPLRALVIPAERFRALLLTEPAVNQRLTATLTARLRSAQSGWAGLAGDPDVLLAALHDLQDSPDPSVAERARRQAASLVEQAAERNEAASVDALAPLSPAERRVAALVAEGLSNQAIADELIVSRHTVDTHVKRCFAKLGLRSRVELATLVLRSS